VKREILSADEVLSRLDQLAVRASTSERPVLEAAAETIRLLLHRHPQSIPDLTEAVARAEEFQYLFRCRIIGVARMNCPKCGYPIEQAMRPSTFQVKCGMRQCNRKYGLGHVLHVLGGGPKSLPPDYVVLKDPAPAGEIGRWRDGQLINRLRME
jgi:hypothetical protein